MTICLVLIFTNPRNFFNPAQTFLLEIAYPFQKFFYVISKNISELFFFFGSIGEMRIENEKIIRDNNSLVAQIAELQTVKKENEMLREQINLAPKNKFNLEASQVIGQDPQGLGSWIMIDKGSSSGVKQNMPVIVFDGILIGKVEDVGLNSAKVNLLTNSASAVNVSDVETGARGLIKGAYGLGISMDMIAQSDVVNENDTIVTSGLGGDIPAGLLVGKIQAVGFSADKLFQQAIITPKIKYQKLDMVFVIKN